MRILIRSTAIGVIIPLLFLSGCIVGPNYNRPPVSTPPAWKEQPPEGWKNATPEDTIGKGNWWEVFNDPELNGLELQAIAANQNLKAAAQRVIEARAVAAATKSSLYPFVGADPSFSGGRQSGNRASQPGSPVLAYTAAAYALPALASYQVDLWGQIRRSLESANAFTQVNVAQYENVLLTLKSDVASLYIMTHYIDRELMVLRDNIDLQQKALDLAQVRRNGGVASGLDVSEAETLLDTTEGDYVGLGVQRNQFEHALAVLLGEPPAVFSLSQKPLDLNPPAIPAGIPADVLERRPDVAAAERKMAAENAQIGVNRAAYFPNLALTANGGLLSAAIGSLFSAPSIVWSAAAGITQPIYTGGRLKANMVFAQATYDESVASYREQVLQAFQEVEDGLSGLRVLEQQAAAYDKAVKSAQQTVDISTSRYREGLANYLEVITAETQLLVNERVSDQILEQRLLTTVQLISALGGGWQDSRIYTTTPPPTSPVSPTPDATIQSAPQNPGPH